MTKNIKKLLIILGVVVIVFIIVVIIPKVQNSTQSQAPLVSKNSLSSNGIHSTPDPSQQFVVLLQSIKSISLDPSLIQSKAFQKLVNYGSILPVDAPAGRPNPFAPIGQDTIIPVVDTTIQDTVNNQTIDSLNKSTNTINQSNKKTTSPSLDSLDGLLNGL